MSESKTWSGHAHDAASDMFRRATDKSSHFLNYARAVAGALKNGSASIGHARIELLREADDIDKGELHVTDQWVVLIKPAGMSAEKAADLQKQAETAQSEVNHLLIAVGDADSATVMNLLSARGGPGGEFHVGESAPVPPAPGDDVPDPRTDTGRQVQNLVRDQDMSTTVREITETKDAQGNKVTTFTMLDGGKQVVTEYTETLPSAMIHPEGTVNITQYDKNGHFVSEVMTIPREDGTKFTETWWADGTHVMISEAPDGSCSGGVTTADGRHGVLPPEFFTDPIPTLIGSSMSGLEKKADTGLPVVKGAALDGIKTGAKLAGPAAGIATAIVNTMTAQGAHEKCVAAWSGGAGVVGGIAADVALAAFAPEAAPIAATAVNAGGSWVFGYLGGIVGNVVCPP